MLQFAKGVSKSHNFKMINQEIRLLPPILFLIGEIPNLKVTHVNSEEFDYR
jgi:hypothetical protein